ncbi:MAG: protein kinase [Bradymonadaceae bacterium]|nr:protein kinase [Lujinxingiaceae bacterium]
MEPDSFLIDATRGEERFRVSELLHVGRSYQIVLARDTHLDDKLVCVKAILYDSERTGDADYVGGRRQALREEMEFLTLKSPLLPDPIDWLEIAQSPVGLGDEPLLVYEYQHGQTLFELVSERHPSGLAPLRALRIFTSLARFLSDIHEAGYVFRDLDPRHVIVGFDDIIHVTGCGNATKMGEPPNRHKADLNFAYVAPEARNEVSGQMLRRASDIYSLGALMSFMLTGEEPRPSVENPLNKDAFDRLSNVDPPGLSLIVARCLQPLAKKRFNHIRQLLPWCDPDNLPTPQSEGFGLILLPAPWTGAESPETNRAQQSKISAGPLISVPPHAEAAPEQSPDHRPAAATPDHNPEQPDDRRRRLLIALAAAALVVALLVLMTVLRAGAA